MMKALSRARTILETGFYTIPDHLKGTGAPGNFLDSLFGVSRNNADIPDYNGVELKFKDNRQSSLTTLLHKEAGQSGNAKRLLDRHGWIGRNGRKSFRNTINAFENSRGFRSLVERNGDVSVYHRDDAQAAATWTSDTINNIFVSKFRRLLVFRGVRKFQQIHFQEAIFHEDLLLLELKKAFMSGKIFIDFDYTLKASGGPRNRGTKFRIKADDIHSLYRHSAPVITALKFAA